MVLIILLVMLNLLGAVLIKASPAYYAQPLAMGVLVASLIAVYGLRSLAWLVVGKHYQLSFVYPFLGINYVLSQFVGMAAFGEPFAARRLVGALVILCGVTLLSFSRHREEVRVAPRPVA